MSVKLSRSLFFILTALVLSFFIVGTGQAIKQTYKSIAPQIVNSSASYPINVDELLALTNRERQAAGFTTLKLDARLNASAQAKCSDMVERNYWGHTDPDGTGFNKFIEDAGLKNYSILGENLAVGQSDATTVNSDLMDSPFHRDNILNPRFSRIGIAVCPYPNYVAYGLPALITVEHFAAP